MMQAFVGLVLALLIGLGSVVPSEPAPASASISGQATWYAYHPGQSAAGPALRSWLGKGWRGTTVIVCAKTCITTRLTDWCQCKGERIVDLDRRDFARLASPSVGVIGVTVARLPEGPATDIEETP